MRSRRGGEPAYEVIRGAAHAGAAARQENRNVPHPACADMRVLANPLKINGKRLDQAVCSPVGADNEAYLAGAAVTP